MACRVWKLEDLWNILRYMGLLRVIFSLAWYMYHYRYRQPKRYCVHDDMRLFCYKWIVSVCDGSLYSQIRVWFRVKANRADDGNNKDHASRNRHEYLYHIFCSIYQGFFFLILLITLMTSSSFAPLTRAGPRVRARSFVDIGSGWLTRESRYMYSEISVSY